MENALGQAATIAVIMSTFNGATFVEAQLKSILEQLPENAQIIIRDDGSSDNTVALIQTIKDERITLSTGPNLGYVRSFFEMMHAVPSNVDIIMFADQDDVWLPDKVRRACLGLQGREGRPTLYASRFRIVGQELQPICSSPSFGQGPSFANSVCENIVIGCTMALNRRGLDLVRRGGDLGRIVSHDWWAYLVISALGDVVCDLNETILYRQHPNNSIGMHPGIQAQIQRLKILTKMTHNINRQLVNLIETHGSDINVEQIRIIRKYFNFRSPASVLRFVLSIKRFRRFPQDELALRCAVALEWCFRRGRLTDLAFPQQNI